MNTIETVRMKVGLSRPQMVELLEDNSDGVELKPAQVSKLFLLDDEEITSRIERNVAGTPSALIKRAKEIEVLYDVWVEDVLARLKRLAERSKDGLLRTTDIARILEVTNWQLSQLRARGKVDAEAAGIRRYLYTYEAIEELIRTNSEALGPDSSSYRGPIATGFFNWAKESSPEDLAVPA